MYVATTKNNFVDTGAANKTTGGTAEQLMGNFSAAVAERMKQVGAVTGERSKNALAGQLETKTEPVAKPRPQNDAPPVEAREPVDNTPPPPRRHEDAPKPRAEAPADTQNSAPDRDDVATPEAPREAARDDAPANRGDDGHNDAPKDEQSAAEDASQDSATDDQTSQTAETASTEQTATGEAVVAVVQQVIADPNATALKGATTKTDGAKAIANDAGAKHKGLESTKDAQHTQNVTAGQKAAEETGDEAEVAPTTEGAKGKVKAAHTQAGQNTHVQADTQAGADKNATVAQQQAADLAKKVGPNQAMNVKVSTTKESEELVSVPSATLAGKATTKADGDGLTQNTALASAKGQAVHGAANNQAGQNGADGQSQNQQQAQSQSLQALAAQAAKTAALGTDGKAAQFGDAANAASTVKVGGTEGMTGTQTGNPTGHTQQTQQTATAQQTQSNPQHLARAQVTEQVTVQIAKAISDGMDKISIQLKPAHLGRVDVELNIHKDGHVTAVVSADNKGTLDLLKQDSRELERALREAGLNLGSSDLSFNLRGQDGQGGNGKDVAQGQSGPAEPLLEPTLEELLETQSSRRDIISETRIDVTA